MENALLVPITKINFENRAGADLSIRGERRGQELVIIIEPGKATSPIRVVPTDQLSRDAQRLLLK